jgi:hypothetical protein
MVLFMRTLEDEAPEGEVTAYDRRNLGVYADLLHAKRIGTAWEDVAVEILGFEPGFDRDGAWRCWETHLARANWIVGEGLPEAIAAFGAMSPV